MSQSVFIEQVRDLIGRGNSSGVLPARDLEIAREWLSSGALTLNTAEGALAMARVHLSSGSATVFIGAGSAEVIQPSIHQSVLASRTVRMPPTAPYPIGAFTLIRWAHRFLSAGVTPESVAAMTVDQALSIARYSNLAEFGPDECIPSVACSMISRAVSRIAHIGVQGAPIGVRLLAATFMYSVFTNSAMGSTAHVEDAISCLTLINPVNASDLFRRACMRLHNTSPALQRVSPTVRVQRVRLIRLSSSDAPQVPSLVVPSIMGMMSRVRRVAAFVPDVRRNGLVVNANVVFVPFDVMQSVLATPMFCHVDGWTDPVPQNTLNVCTAIRTGVDTMFSVDLNAGMSTNDVSFMLGDVAALMAGTSMACARMASTFSSVLLSCAYPEAGIGPYNLDAGRLHVITRPNLVSSIGYLNYAASVLSHYSLELQCAAIPRNENQIAHFVGLVRHCIHVAYVVVKGAGVRIRSVADTSAVCFYGATRRSTIPIDVAISEFDGMTSALAYAYGHTTSAIEAVLGGILCGDHRVFMPPEYPGDMIVDDQNNLVDFLSVDLPPPPFHTLPSAPGRRLPGPSAYADIDHPFVARVLNTTAIRGERLGVNDIAAGLSHGLNGNISHASVLSRWSIVVRDRAYYDSQMVEQNLVISWARAARRSSIAVLSSGTARPAEAAPSFAAECPAYTPLIDFTGGLTLCSNFTEVFSFVESVISLAKLHARASV